MYDLPGNTGGSRWAHSGEKSSQCGKSLAGEGKELRTPLTQPGGALSVRGWVQAAKTQPLCETGAVGVCPPSTTQGTGGSTHRLERGLLGATAWRCPGGMDHPLPPGCKALGAPLSQDPRGHERGSSSHRHSPLSLLPRLPGWGLGDPGWEGGGSPRSQQPPPAPPSISTSKGEIQRDGVVKRRGQRRLSLARAPGTLPLTP